MARTADRNASSSVGIVLNFRIADHPDGIKAPVANLVVGFRNSESQRDGIVRKRIPEVVREVNIGDSTLAR